MGNLSDDDATGEGPAAVFVAVDHYVSASTDRLHWQASAPRIPDILERVAVDGGVPNVERLKPVLRSSAPPATRCCCRVYLFAAHPSPRTLAADEIICRNAIEQFSPIV